MLNEEEDGLEWVRGIKNYAITVFIPSRNEELPQYPIYITADS